jgi:sirohydrochlorin ferrochelatase
MKGLLLVAHGSRRAASNDEVRALASLLRTKASPDFDFTSCAFLELAEPSIPDGIEQCIQQGAKHVLVLPYFLSAGRHVVTDIPEEVRLKQDEYPEIKIEIAPYLGASNSIVDILMALTR